MAESPPTEAALTFGTLLRRYRLAAGLTQDALAERAGRQRRLHSAAARGIAGGPA